MLRRLFFAISLVLMSAVALAKPLNINTANEKEIAKTMYGVGPSRAKAIIKFREANGEFKTLDQMTQVRGVSTAILEKNRDKIAVE